MALVTTSVHLHVRVDRSLTPDEVLSRTGRVRWHMANGVLAEMPSEGFEEGNVEFFELDYNPSAREIDRAYKVHGLRPDPYALAQVVTNDPAFADERPVAVQWRDKKNRACCMFFHLAFGERGVGIYIRSDIRGRNDMFAGVRT